jgi:hypothetical protein
VKTPGWKKECKKSAKKVADSGKGIIFATTLTKDAEKKEKRKT